MSTAACSWPESRQKAPEIGEMPITGGPAVGVEYNADIALGPTDCLSSAESFAGQHPPEGETRQGSGPWLQPSLSGEQNAMSTIEERVKKVVLEQLEVSADQVTPEASFIDDLGADSLDTVELVMALEEEFGLEIPDDKAESIAKVKDAVQYIKEHSPD